MNDKTKLSEDMATIQLIMAMGWTPAEDHGDHPEWRSMWFTPEGSGPRPRPKLFTDANNDYAVLEWMRSLTNTSEVVGRSMWNSFCDALAEDEVNHVSCRKWNYTVGDYARAALMVLDTDPPASCRICGGDEANHATYSHQYKPDTDREGQ